MRPHAALASLAGATLLLTTSSSFAGREPEEWDDLPQVESISFSEAAVGFSTGAGRHYVLDRRTGELGEVSAEHLAQAFAGTLGAKAAERKGEIGIETERLLRTSDGKTLETRDAYCAEGEDAEHALSMGGVPVATRIDPCESVSCAEIVGENLWLGTRHDGEYGEYPSSGIFVQTLDGGVHVRTLSTKDGLTGDLIRVIRRDPFEADVWVATNEGINVVAPDFRVLRSLFFYQVLDPRTGTKVGVSSLKRKSSPLATIYKELHVSDAKAYYDAVGAVPMELQEQFWNHLNNLPNRSPDGALVEMEFAPEQLEALVPFFLTAAMSDSEEPQRYALFHLCSFDAPRVVDFVVARCRRTPSPSNLDAYQTSHDASCGCLQKFRRLGSTPPPAGP